MAVLPFRFLPCALGPNRDIPPCMRIILHMDMDAYFAAIEELDNPQLRGKPVIIGGSGMRRRMKT